MIITGSTQRPAQASIRAGWARGFEAALSGVIQVGWLAIWLGLIAAGMSYPLAAQQSGRSNQNGLCELLTAEGEIVVSIGGAENWQKAKPGQILGIGDRLRTSRESRAILRFSDLSVLRINELTTFEILAPEQKGKRPLLDLKSGSVYFFSREKPADIHFRTPSAAGAIRGTEFYLQAFQDRAETRLALLDGEVELGNPAGVVQLRGGEEARVIGGHAPEKSPLIDAINVIQWCLYYPAVVDSDEIPFSATERESLRNSIDSYRSGDLSGALAQFSASAHPDSQAVVVYHAALVLSVGQVEEATRLLKSIPASSLPGQALEKMIAATQFRPWTGRATPASASQWLAQSYLWQSQAQLEEALQAARAAAGKAPTFGFAWVRVAELEFALGYLSKARESLAKGLQYSPRNAQAVALEGFVALARNRTGAALDYFNQAIALDGALGNAWLGKGLCQFRRRRVEEGRADLQVAAALEPQRALFRSYLAKAFASEGKDALASKDLRLAKKLDPNDPTAWLYSALINQQRNRINEAIRDLETAKDLNDNQAIFRSKLLLDKDQASRSADLAMIYQDAGMFDVSVREAQKAVSMDYANSSAHLFLADSYDDLRDPHLFNLRFDAPALSEWLVANLLAPAGAEALPRSIAARDYIPLFERDGLGFSSETEYLSRGAWSESASQFGNYGGLAYSVDAQYWTDPGQRPNNDLQATQFSAETKAQVTDHDSFFLQAEYFKQQTGDVQEYFSQESFNPKFRFTEEADPSLFLGYHRAWQPGVDTLFLAGRLQGDLTLQNPLAEPLFFFHHGGTGPVTWVAPLPQPFDLTYSRSVQSYSAELQQIWVIQSHTLIVGGRFQTGDAEAASHLMNPLLANIPQDIDTDLDRESVYAYDYWQIIDPLQLTLGVACDRLNFPSDIDTAPLTAEQTLIERVSPKAGFIYTPWQNAMARFHYTRSVSGAFNENSYQLEPTLVGGLNQAFRSAIPESAAGLVPGAPIESWAAAIDQSFKTGTYLSLTAEQLQSDTDRVVGALTNAGPIRIPNAPSTTVQALDFRERTLSFNVNQLIARDFALGAAYRISAADLQGRFPEVPATARGASALVQNETSVLNTLTFYAIFNHPSGFFSQFQSVWNFQSNEGFNPDEPGDSFWQENVFVGYRFFRQRAEVRAGILNLTDQNYRLEPLNLYVELPRERTFVANLRFCF